MSEITAELNQSSTNLQKYLLIIGCCFGKEEQDWFILVAMHKFGKSKVA